MKQKLLILLGIVFFLMPAAFAQTHTVSGTVSGKDDALPIPGVIVKVKGVNNTILTNINGKYSISLPNDGTLVFSFTGYASQEVSSAGKSVVDVTLVSLDKQLGEVVVVGYQSIRKGDVVGSYSTVDAKSFEEKPIISFTEELQGTATGVQVTTGSGRPGDNGVIRIRGTGSITASSSPLVVLDGNPITTTAYSEINPDDIASVTILKDASAVAIYGSRGSNGVLLVTTKSGKANNPVVNFSSRYGITQREALKNVQLMNSAQKFQYEYEVGYTDPTIDSMINNRPALAGKTITTLSDDQRNTLFNLAASRGAGDWGKYFFQNAMGYTNQLSLSGGADKLTYYMSGNINNNAGVERFSGFNRKGGRLNVTYEIYPWLKMGSNIGVTSSHEARVREAYNSQNAYGSLYFFNPYEPVYNADGSYNSGAIGFSPLEGAVNNPTTYDIVSDFGTFYAEAKFFKHLTIKSQYGLDYNTTNYSAYTEPGSNLANILGYNQKNDQVIQDLFYSFTNTAIWNQTIGGHHTINALIGTEYDKDNAYTISATGRGFPSAAQTTLENATTPTTASTSLTQYALISYFSSLSYDYDKRYFINASGRRDGSSLFGANVQFGNFGAIGAAWDLKNEKFFTLPNWVTDLKIRGSYGTSGNNSIPLYRALGTYSLTGRYNDQTAAIPNNLANPNLTWENSLAKDVGITYGLFGGRLSGEIDYYNRVNRNLLYPVNVSQTTGFTSLTGNVGAVRNRGFEFSAKYQILRGQNDGLRWDINFNYTHNDNAVTQLYSDNATGVSANGLGKLVIGQPINVFYLVKDKGVNPADGKETYYNIDGSTTETFAGGQAQIINGASPNVKYYGSFGTTLAYKGIDFSASFYYTGGNYIYNQIYMDEVNSSSVSGNLFTAAENYWKKPGDVVPFPSATDPTQSVENYSTKFLEKGDYLELRDVTLGYTLKSAWAKKAHLAGVRFFAQGTNLYVWTKYHGNPEISEAGETTSFSGQLSLYSYPPVRSYTFGVDVKF